MRGGVISATSSLRRASPSAMSAGAYSMIPMPRSSLSGRAGSLATDAISRTGSSGEELTTVTGLSAAPCSMSPVSGIRIHPPCASPPTTWPTITAYEGLPCAKFHVPSTGSRVQAASLAPRRSVSAGLCSAASSPTTGMSTMPASSGVSASSDSMSAMVTKSLGPFLVLISPSAKARKRGRMMSSATSRIALLTASISTCP